MHDVNLGQTIRDYLTGEEVEMTTYEDLRQALSKLLVEEKGIPAGNIQPRVPVSVDIEGKKYTRVVDLVVYDNAGAPLMIMIFCPGEPSTYVRESLAAARLIDKGPARLVVVTDTRNALLVDANSGETIEAGMSAIPDWDRINALSQKIDIIDMNSERIEREKRILLAYSESLYSCCGAAACAAGERGGGWDK